MAKQPLIANPPNHNPKLGDYLKGPGASAKPPVAPSKVTGPLPRNTRGRK